jgi:multidrug efflux pump subunit AcrA (membrane-fusion protein)
MSPKLAATWSLCAALAIVAASGAGRATLSQTPELQVPLQSPVSAKTAKGASSSSVGWLTVKDCFVKGEAPIKIPAQETGLLDSLVVQENQAVIQGQLIAKLDESDATAEYDVRNLQYQMALEAAKDNPDVDFLTKEADHLSEEYKRYSAIAKSVSDTELMVKKLAAERAKVSLHKAKQGQVMAELIAKRELATVTGAQLKLKRLEIVAPRDGVVTELLCSQGEWVTAGTTIGLLEDLEHLRVDAFVPIDQFDRTRIINSEVRIEYDGAEGKIRLAGKIVSHDQDLSSGGLLRLRARVQNVRNDGHWALLKGTQVTMHIAVPTGREQVSTRELKAKPR